MGGAADRAARDEELSAAQARVTAWGGWFALLQAGAPVLAAMAALGLSLHAPLPPAAMAALGAAMTVDGAGALLRGLEVQRQPRRSPRPAWMRLLQPPAAEPRASCLPARPWIVLAEPAARCRPAHCRG